MLLKLKLTNSECILMPYLLKFCRYFSSERPVTIYHVLKLFLHSQPADSNALLFQGKKNVVSEFYDEIIFQVP